MHIKGAVIVALSLITFSSRCGENDAELGVQLQRMQAQMSSMAEKLEAQQKKIDSQDRMLAAIQGRETVVSDGTLDKNLTGAPHPKDSGIAGARNSNDSRSPFELPPVSVTADAQRQALESSDPNKIGKYGQPLWTTRRRFSETRAYVIPEGDFEFEYWNVTEKPQHGPTTSEQKYEAEIGLGHRLQLDIYGLSHSKGNNRGFGFDEHDVELRYAFADWDAIPGNPTAYAEYKFMNGEPDHVEFKALFSGDVGQCQKKLQWAANTVYETQMGGKREASYEVTGGLSYQIEPKFALGGETKMELDDRHNNRFNYGLPQLLIGPSLQYTPFKQLHIDFSPLVGVTKTAPEIKSLVIVGWKF